MHEPSSLYDYWFSELQKGNSLALSHFFDLHYRSICYFADSIVKDSLEAEDIAATAFMKLWRKHKDLESASSIKSFLYICARNACLDYLKKKKRQTSAQAEYYNLVASSDDYILKNLIEAEFLQQLTEEIEALPPQCKMVFKRMYFDGLKTDEIADELSLSVKTVRNHKSRAISLLQATLLKKKLLPTLLCLSIELLKSKLPL